MSQNSPQGQGASGSGRLSDTIDSLCDAFELAWLEDQEPNIEDYLQGVRGRTRKRLFRELLAVELEHRFTAGEQLSAEDYLQRFSDCQEEIEQTIREIDQQSSSSNQGPTDLLSLEKLVEAGVVSRQASEQFQREHPEILSSREQLVKKLHNAALLTDLQKQRLLETNLSQIVLGNYVVQEQIGRGGMGEVYRAMHRRMQRDVALKILPASLIDNQEAIQRFHREVQAVAQLKHPHIVTAYDADEADGVHFFAMEYVQGIDLAKMVRRDGPLPVEKAMHYMLQASRGLAYAHAQGIIHRDVKPSNLLIDEREDVVKILDLGLARFEQEKQKETADTPNLTTTGTMLGTAHFMPPEQAVNTSLADARSDVYALGYTLFHILTGKLPYNHHSMIETIFAHRDEAIPSLKNFCPQISADLDSLYEDMVAKSPEERPANMLAVVERLEQCSLPPECAADGDFSSREPITRQGAAEAGIYCETAVIAKENASDEVGNDSPETVSIPTETVSQKRADQDSQPLVRPAESKNSFGIGSRRSLWSVLGVLAVAAFAAGIFLELKTPIGTVVLEIDQSEAQGAQVSVDGKQIITITREGKEPIKVAADEQSHQLQVIKGGFETFTKEFRVKEGEKTPIRVSLVRKKAEPSPEPTPTPSITASERAAAQKVLDPQWSPSAEQQGFLDETAPLDPDDQVEAIRQKLIEIHNEQNNGEYYLPDNADFYLDDTQTKDGKIVHVKLRGRWGQTIFQHGFRSPGSELQLWPLAALKHLKSLDANACVTPATNISPLTRLPLEELTGVGITPFHSRAAELVTAIPHLQSINGVSPQAWLKRKEEIENLRETLAQLTPDEQLGRVVEKLKEYNSGFDAEKMEYEIHDAEVRALSLKSTGVTDLSPVQAFPALRSLNCSNNPGLSDLSPIAGMEIRWLACISTAVSDLSPLRGMPLDRLQCQFTPVSDLFPLTGMPLENLECGFTRVSDLSPLQQLPLNALSINGTPVDSLSQLKRMQLKSLKCAGVKASDLSPLTGMKLTSLEISLTDVSTLASLEGMPLEELHCHGTRVWDLAPLQGMPLKHLDLRRTLIPDLSQFKKLSLGSIEEIQLPLRLFHTPDDAIVHSLGFERQSVSGDLGPAEDFSGHLEERRQAAKVFAEEAGGLLLKDRVAAVTSKIDEMSRRGANRWGKVESFDYTTSNDGVSEATITLKDDVRDITPLMALQNLEKLTLKQGPPWLDISPLKNLPLRELDCNDDIAFRNEPVLREMHSLQKINDQPAKDYLDSLQPPSK